MNVLVTGGAGFIGSHLCERLLSEGMRVSIVDDLNNFYRPQEKLNNLEQIRRRGAVAFLQADICDGRYIKRLMQEQEVEAVIHMAARVGVRPSIEDPLGYERTNVQGTISVLEAAREAGVRRFILASSSSIYGIANQVPFREDDTANLPISPYAATKLAAEKICYTYSHLYPLACCCLRFFTVYGPRQRPDLAISKFIGLIEEGQPVPVFGDGSSGRDYTYCEDVVAGIVAALGYDCRYEIFNLGNSHPVRLRELIAAIEAAVGKPASTVHHAEQPGDVPLTYADITKAQRLLGYRPATSFAAGLAKQVGWYREQTRRKTTPAGGHA
jgi:UDP-glucuronate 4-epimerase